MPIFTPAQAHEFNLDSAQREIDSRSAQGEDMSWASINQFTYAIVNPQAGKDYTAQRNAHGNVIVCKGHEVRKSYRIIFTGSFADCRAYQ